MVYLWEYDWPGNVRELENLVERMVILSETGHLAPEDLPPHVRSFISEKKLPHPDFSDGEVNLREILEQFEGRLIDEALRRTNGNKTAAAQMLGLKRTTLVAKLRRKKNGTARTLASSTWSSMLPDPGSIYAVNGIGQLPRLVLVGC